SLTQDREGWAQGAISVIDDPTNAFGFNDGGNGGRMRDLTDGSSNTMMIGELADRTVLYRAPGQRVIPTSDPEAAVNQVYNGAAWASPLNGALEVSGRLYDGTPDRGPCTVNCSNARTRDDPSDFFRFGAGMFSFHEGG